MPTFLSATTSRRAGTTTATWGSCSRSGPSPHPPSKDGRPAVSARRCSLLPMQPRANVLGRRSGSQSSWPTEGGWQLLATVRTKGRMDVPSASHRPRAASGIRLAALSRLPGWRRASRVSRLQLSITVYPDVRIWTRPAVLTRCQRISRRWPSPAESAHSGSPSLPWQMCDAFPLRVVTHLARGRLRHGAIGGFSARPKGDRRANGDVVGTER